MTYTVKRKLVLVLMLVLMLLMLVPFEALAQEATVNSNVESTGIYPAVQDRAFYDDSTGMYWVFFIDSDGYLVYSSSADEEGNPWSAHTDIVGTGIFDIAHVDGYVFLAYQAGTSGYYYRGVLASNGVVTWGTLRTVVTNATLNKVSICITSAGYPYYAYYTGSYYGGSLTCQRSSRTHADIETLGWSATTDVNIATTIAADKQIKVFALTGVRAAIVTETNATPKKGIVYRYTGTGWSSGVTTTYGVRGETYITAVAQDDYVHVAYQASGDYDIYYEKYDYSTNAFSGITKLWDSSGGVHYTVPEITLDTDTNDLWVFQLDLPSNNHGYFHVYNVGTASWTLLTDWFTDSDGIGYGYFLNSIIPTDRAHLGLFHTSKAGAPYDLKWNYLMSVFEVDTLSASPVGLTSATLRGEIVSLGFGSADERGFVLNDSPTLVGASLEGNETGTFNVGVFTHGVTGLDVFSTYWYAAYASNEWGTEYGNWTSFDTVLSIPTPPSGNVTGDTATICNTTAWNFLAMPITNTDIKLTWDWYPTTGNSSVQISIRYDLYHYPSNTTDGTLIYQGTSDAYTHTNLTPGTTYYYRGWLLCGGNYSADYVEDWATTYGSSPVVSPPEQPGGWFQDPSCIAYGKIPLLSDALTAITTGYGFPMTTVCVMFTLLWIIILGFVIFLFIHSAMMMIITIAVLIILASIMGLLPLWMIVIAICLGGISIYVSSRT